MTTLQRVTVGCCVSCQFDLRRSKADTHRLVTRQQSCIKSGNTHSCWLHLHQVYPCTLFQLFSPTMVPPDPAGANDRAGLVKKGHLPFMASLPMPLLRGGVWWWWLWREEEGAWCEAEQEAASGGQPLCGAALCFSHPYRAPLIQVPKKV